MNAFWYGTFNLLAYNNAERWILPWATEASLVSCITTHSVSMWALPHIVSISSTKDRMSSIALG